MPLPCTLHCLSGPSCATASLETAPWLCPGVALATWTRTPGHAVIDLLRVPEHCRRQGVGSMVYRSWEKRVAPGTVVELFAVDAVARAFWSSLGFEDIGDGGMEKILAQQDRSDGNAPRMMQGAT